MQKPLERPPEQSDPPAPEDASEKIVPLFPPARPGPERAPSERDDEDDDDDPGPAAA